MKFKITDFNKYQYMLNFSDNEVIDISDYKSPEDYAEQFSNDADISDIDEDSEDYDELVEERELDYVHDIVNNCEIFDLEDILIECKKENSIYIQYFLKLGWIEKN